MFVVWSMVGVAPQGRARSRCSPDLRTVGGVDDAACPGAALIDGRGLLASVSTSAFVREASEHDLDLSPFTRTAGSTW